MDQSQKIILIFRARFLRNHKVCETSQKEISPSCALQGLDFRCSSREQSAFSRKRIPL